MNDRRPTWSIVALLLFVASPLLAHDDTASSAGLLSGLGHPVSGWDHILAMLAVGIWGGQLGKPALWLLPVGFPMMMAVGGFLGLAGVTLPGVEVGIAFSALALGLLIALKAKPPLPVALGLVGVFAIFHGHAHGTELAPGSDAIAYSAGFVIATGLLHLAGILVGTVHARAGGRTILRLAGTLVAAGGVFFLVRAFA